MKTFHTYHLLFLITLAGIIICLIKIIFAGHIMNGDFALYVRQAESIVKYDPQKLLEDMQKMIELSTYQRYSPVLYPWGYPLLLSPLVYFFGTNYTVFKIFSGLCLLVSMIILYLNFHQKNNTKEALITVFLTGFNLLFIYYSNQVISELPYLLFATLTLYCINKIPEKYFDKTPIGYYLMIGFLLFMCFQIRTEGIFLSISLFVIQVYILAKNKNKSHNVKMKYILSGLVPYLFAALLFCSFSAFFPAGFLQHTSHLNVINFDSILKNITNYVTIPADVLGIHSSYFYTSFWVITIIGIYSVFRLYIAEVTYVLLTISMLVFWPYSEIRYWISVIPFIVFFFIRGIFYLTEVVNKRWSKHLSYLIISTFILLIGTETIHQLCRPIFPYDKINPNVNGQTSVEIFRFIKSNTSSEDVIACSESRAIYLYTGRISCNLTGELSDTIKKADWYILFTHRGNYLQYDPFSITAYKKYFEKAYSNSDYIIYKIKKP